MNCTKEYCFNLNIAAVVRNQQAKQNFCAAIIVVEEWKVFSYIAITTKLENVSMFASGCYGTF